MGIGYPENTCQPTNIVDCFYPLDCGLQLNIFKLIQFDVSCHVSDGKIFNFLN